MAALPVALIVNPKAGLSSNSARLRQWVELLERHGLQVRHHVVRKGLGPGAAAKQALRDGIKLIVAAGGDGTISAVASELVDTDATLGIIPAGTLNHFAKDLHIPLDYEAAIQVIAQGKTLQVDVGEVNGRIFINNSGIGLYPRVVSWRQRRQRWGYSKWIALLWASAIALRRLSLLKVRVKANDTQIVRATPLVFIGNNEYEMSGLNAGARGCLDGSKLFVCIVRASSGWQLVRTSLSVLFRRSGQMDELDSMCVKDLSVDVSRKSILVSLDGEITRMATPLSYRTRPGALRVIVP